MTMSNEKRTTKYIRWQNRAFRFYVAARCCYRKSFYAPASFLCFQSVELLQKATLLWYDPSFEPKRASHDLESMEETIRKQVPGQNCFKLPAYLFDKSYQETSRYPLPSGEGICLPEDFISKLDTAFTNLIEMVDIGFSNQSELHRTLQNPQIYPQNFEELQRNNQELERLRKHVVGKRVGCVTEIRQTSD